jgi:hypothetical protein
MSEDAGFVEESSEPVEVETVEPTTAEWESILQVVPEGLHEIVRPELEKYNQTMEDRLYEVNQKYESWEPIIDVHDAETTAYALGILDRLNSDPRGLYDAMREHYGWQDQVQAAVEQSNGWQQDEETIDTATYEEDPRITELQQGMEAIAQLLVTEREQYAAQEADNELEQELISAKQKYGDFDERYVLLDAINNDIDLDTAIRNYKQLEESLLIKNNQPPAPSVIGSSGGVPVVSVDPKNLNPQETRSLVVEMLRASKESS